MGFLSSAFAKEAVLGVLNAVFVGNGTVLDATFRSAFTVATDNAVLGQTVFCKHVLQKSAKRFCR